MPPLKSLDAEHIYNLLPTPVRPSIPHQRLLPILFKVIVVGARVPAGRLGLVVVARETHTVRPAPCSSLIEARVGGQGGRGEVGG